MVTTSGSTPKCWKPNHLPVRPKPGLHLVDHEQQAALVAQRAARPGGTRRWPGARRPRPGPARAARRRRSGRWPPRARRGRPGDVAEALGQRLERLVLGRLAGGVQRGERAAVERAVGADHDVAAAPAPLAGQLDGALVGLGAGVAEEHLAAAAEQRGRSWRPRPVATSGCRTGSTRAAACGPARRAASATAGWAWPSDVTASPQRKSR